MQNTRLTIDIVDNMTSLRKLNLNDTQTTEEGRAILSEGFTKLNRLFADEPFEHHSAILASQMFPVAENTEFFKMTATQFARRDFPF